MAVNYTSLKSKAAKLIQDNGVAIIVSRVGGSGTWTKKYDPTTQRVYWEDSESNIVYTAPTGVTTETSGYGVISQWPLRLIEQGVVQVGDVRMTVSVDTTIEVGDKITMGSQEFQVIDPIERVKPDGSTMVIQTVNLRENVN